VRTSQERAARLLRWYPKAWRQRYGDEFAELLVADIEERPQSVERALDIVRAGLLARLAVAGLAEPAAAWQPDPARRVQVSLGVLCGGLTACLALAAAMWSQLAVAWEWTLPATETRPTMRATLVMSAAMLAFLLLIVLAVAPVGCAVVRNFNARLLCPLLVLAGAVSLLAFGGHHFLYQWPGSGGHGAGATPFPGIPAGIQAFAWSLTYWFSACWIHSSWLTTGLGGWEIAWILASPLTLAAGAAAAATLVRRAELSPRLLAYQTRLATAACAVMGVFLGGCTYWVYVGRSPGQTHAGQIDIAAAVLLALALTLACQAQRTALRGLRLTGS
jgi:hypothetical protein